MEGQAPALLENITTTHIQKSLYNSFLFLFTLLECTCCILFASRHAVQLSECTQEQMLAIVSQWLRQKPNETSCSDMPTLVQSDDHSLVFGNLARIQTCSAE